MSAERAAAWLIRRLERHGIRIEPGNGPEARARIRSAITGADLGAVICGSVNRKPQIYRAAFERAFAEPLEPQRRRAPVS